MKDSVYTGHSHSSFEEKPLHMFPFHILVDSSLDCFADGVGDKLFFLSEVTAEPRTNAAKGPGSEGSQDLRE